MWDISTKETNEGVFLTTKTKGDKKYYEIIKKRLNEPQKKIEEYVEVNLTSGTND